MDISLGFGQRVRFLRRLKGLTQEAFAAEIDGATQGRITRLEKAQSETLRFEILGSLIRICKDVGMPLDWFVYGDGPLLMRVSPDRFAKLQGVDVPPGVQFQLVIQEHSHGSAATESDSYDDTMDGDDHQGGGGE